MNRDMATGAPLSSETLRQMNAGLDTSRSLRRKLDNLGFSADQKALLSALLDTVYSVGSKIVEIGRAVLTFAFNLINIAPGTTFGIVVGAALTALIAGLPIFGPLLSAILGPFLVAFGLGAGAVSDFLSGTMAGKFDAFTKRYAPLTA